MTTTDRPGNGRREALADVCGYVLDHASTVPRNAGGHRPHVNVLVRLEDLQNRARAACLDFGGPVSAESLRMLCCDAAVVPIVMNGTGQPLDVGRATRTIPDGLRRAVAARDAGCAHPARASYVLGGNSPPVGSGSTGARRHCRTCAMLCSAHHRQIHSTEWLVRIRDGLPEFIPPPWIDPIPNDHADEPCLTSPRWAERRCGLSSNGLRSRERRGRGCVAGRRARAPG